MEKLEFIFIIIEAITILIEIGLQIYEIITAKNLEKYLKEKIKNV